MNIMALKSFILKDIKYYGVIGFWTEYLINKLYFSYKSRGGVKKAIDRSFYKVFKRNINWEDPQTLNEKMQFLKVYGFKDFHTVCADKYRMREYLTSKFGNTFHQIPVLYVTENWRDITLDVIPNEPCVIKANHTQGDVVILKDKRNVDIKRLRIDCHWWMLRNLYKSTYEPQYKDIKPLIMIEKMLLTKNGTIPNDYKLHYLNGELKFVYCSVEREGINKRNIYDENWNPLYFTWSEPFKDASTLRGPEIEAPASFKKMKELANVIAQDFKYVRVDFYDVDGDLYFGEITLHHGSGLDIFVPEEYDYIYGKMLNIK